MSSSDDPNEKALRGRPFAKGNPGRPVGATNHRTRLLGELLQREEKALLEKAIQVAGEPTILKFLLDRTLPKRRTIEIDVPPILVASDAVDAIAAITQAVGAGQISPDEGAAVAALVESYGRIINVADLELRLQLIEQKLSEANANGSKF